MNKPGTKHTGGITLVELLMTLALLSVVMAVAGSSMYAAVQSYAANTKMQKNEYSARLALLCITREVHRGVSAVNINTVDGMSELKLTMLDGITTITYKLDEDKVLVREIAGGDSPVPFLPVELTAFHVSFYDLDASGLVETDHGRWLMIEVKYSEELNLSLKTTIAVSRVPGVLADAA